MPVLKAFVRAAPFKGFGSFALKERMTNQIPCSLRIKDNNSLQERKSIS